MVSSWILTEYWKLRSRDALIHFVVEMSISLGPYTFDAEIFAILTCDLDKNELVILKKNHNLLG